MNKIRMILLYVASSLQLFALTPEEVAQKSHMISSGFQSSVATIELVLKNKTGAKATRRFISKTIEKKDGTKNLIEFIYPKDLLGTKLLTHEYRNRDDEQWLYLSSIKRIKKIASSQKSSPFMGSEFTYEDIIRTHYSKYIYDQNLKSTKGVYIIQRKPKDPRSGYKRQVLYIDKHLFLLKKVEYYNEGNVLFKRCVFENYKKDKGVYLPFKIHMKNILTGKESFLITKKRTNFLQLNASVFSRRKLQD